MKADTIRELRKRKDEITISFLSQLKADSNLVKTLGDNMAEAATNMQGQGYANFVNSRELFISELNRMHGEYALFLCSELSASKQVD